jgi:hypothetical protein
MKRTHSSRQRATARPSPGHRHVPDRDLDARRLAGVRGGAGLGIAVEVVRPLSSIMSQQHNELLIKHQITAEE